MSFYLQPFVKIVLKDVLSENCMKIRAATIVDRSSKDTDIVIECHL